MWKDITLPDNWLLTNENYQGKIQNDTNDFDYVQQYSDGTVKISFKDLRVNTPSRMAF